MNVKYYNPNPEGRNVGDCTVRALCRAMDKEWEPVYTALCLQGYQMRDMPSSNAVWGAYLRAQGFRRALAPEDVTVEEFAAGHRQGTYILTLSGHVVCVQDGALYDTWDSSHEIVLYYWTKEEE